MSTNDLDLDRDLDLDDSVCDAIRRIVNLALWFAFSCEPNCPPILIGCSRALDQQQPHPQPHPQPKEST